jgi:hypothetical protein
MVPRHVLQLLLVIMLQLAKLSEKDKDKFGKPWNSGKSFMLGFAKFRSNQTLLDKISHTDN